ncbi:MAG: ABC transporter substrate-binding protein [Clostridiales bacterium]|nr:ABC transporter substrate-binding protein [Clostridiales bacterium]
MNRKKILLTIIMFLLLTLILAACKSTGNDAVKTETPSSSPGSSSTPAATPAPEVVFRMSRSWENASTWDPLDHTGNATAALIPQIFEALARLDDDGSSLPWLAESWEESADGLTFTFHLRQGVQFHKGYGEMTSEDVKFSFERHLDPELASLHLDALNLANVDSIETPDPYTAVFRFKQPDVDFITRVSDHPAFIQSKAAFDALGYDGFKTTPIGTGPFQFDKGTLGGQTEAVKFSQFWGGEPKIDRVTNIVITDTNTNYSAFEKKEIDMLYVYYMDKVNEYKAAGYRDYYLPTKQILYVGMNMQMASVNDAKVREAIFHAIDPQYFIDSLFYGLETFPGGYMPPGCKYALNTYLKPSFDTEKAKALLAEAGYNNNLKLTLWSVNDDISPPPALIVQQQLAAVGINLELQLVDFNVFIEKVRGGEAQMWLLYNGAPILCDSRIARYTSSSYPGNNWVGMLDPVYDDLVARGLASSSVEEKTELLNQAQMVFMDHNTLYPVCTYGFFFMTQPEWEGIELWGDLSLRLRNAYKKTN